MNKQVKEVCKMDGGVNRCRYLVSKSSGYECHKFWPSGRKKIDNLIATGVRQFRPINCRGQKNSVLNEI